MILHYVEKNGVHLRRVLGIFDSEVAAMEALVKAKQQETDDYHYFSVSSKRLNEYEEKDIKRIEIFLSVGK